MARHQFMSTFTLGAVIGATFYPLTIHLLAYLGVHLGFALDFGIAMLAAALIGLLFWSTGGAWRKQGPV
ncbi:MAG: hypothetical protein KIT16_12325 [Rhodospirillaceae bacterium]|nr:hypothetical protein [Rhodospirillaceae bacterium]